MYSGLGGLSINKSAFTVGDSWEISITGGPPNTGVFFNTNVSGTVMPMSGQQDIALSLLLGSYATGSSPVGTTDGAGNLNFSGSFNDKQVGTWTINVTAANGQSLGGVQFTVANAQGSIAYTGPTVPGGVAYYTLATPHVPDNPSQYTQSSLLAASQVKSSQAASAATGVTANTGSTVLPDLSNTITSATGMSSTELLMIAGGLIVAYFMFKGGK